MGETAAARRLRLRPDGAGSDSGFGPAASSGMRPAAWLHDGGAPGRVGMRSSPTGPRSRR